LPLPQAERVAAHSRQLSDVHAALEWSFGPSGDVEIATRLAVRAIAGQLKVLADDYQQRAEKASHVDVAKAFARSAANAEGEWGTC
jgi:hypothetical protein